jgi:hypothetical protein
VNFRGLVTAMRFAELYNGANDNRVFLYGDGTNTAIYSGLDYDGEERADYFPDLNVLEVGARNAPVTGMIRHYAQLAVFKSDSAYTVRYGTITLESGAVTAAFYVTPANRDIGNEAPGQVQLVENSPRTLWGGAAYEWRNYSSYVGNIDERQSRVVSRRVYATLGAMDLKSAFTFNDDQRQEYYIVAGGIAAVNSYATDTWFIYTGFDFTRLFVAGGELYGGGPGGVAHIARRYAGDDGGAIWAFWRSGSLAFDSEWRRKFVPRLFVTVKPEARAHLVVSARTNRRSDYAEMATAAGLVTFAGADFRHWSFGTNRQPQTVKLKLRARKFAYCQLILESNENWSTATALTADIKLHKAGDVRGASAAN